MGIIREKVTEEKGPLGFGTRYRAEVTEGDDVWDMAIKRETAVSSTPENALENAREQFRDKK
jgi:hypothetical protein